MESSNKESYSEYGEYSISTKERMNFPKTQIIVEKKETKFSYYRINSEGQEIRKSIPGKKEKLRIEIAPVLPLNLPAKKTHDLMFLRLKDSIFVEKNSTVEILVQFPIEIGVFVINNDNSKDFFDCFTCEPMHSRFALYGTPEKGTLCMYGKVDTLNTSEKPLPFVFAKMKAKISNKLKEGITIGKLVFPVTHHSIYYPENSSECHIDDISATIKKELNQKIIEIHHDELSKKGKTWKRSPKPDIKLEKEAYTMTRGFD